LVIRFTKLPAIPPLVADDEVLELDVPLAALEVVEPAAVEDEPRPPVELAGVDEVAPVEPVPGAELVAPTAAVEAAEPVPDVELVEPVPVVEPVLLPAAELLAVVPVVEPALVPAAGALVVVVVVVVDRAPPLVANDPTHWFCVNTC